MPNKAQIHEIYKKLYRKNYLSNGFQNGDLLGDGNLTTKFQLNISKIMPATFRQKHCVKYMVCEYHYKKDLLSARFTNFFLFYAPFKR